MQPDVTVVIPTRDRWSQLSGAALAAARLQVGVEIEVVVVDDGSSTTPPDELRNPYPPVRVVRHPEPQGVAAARNTGIREASAEWVAFLDDDDVWAPDKLRRQLDAVRDAGAGFGYAGAVWVDPDLRLLYGHAPPNPAELASALLRWNVIWGGGSNVLARTELVRAVGSFDENLFQLADWDLWIRLALGACGAAVEETLVALVVHRESMLLVDRRDVFLELAYLCDKHRESGSRAGVSFDTAAFARWVAGGHLRAGRRRAAARAFVRGTRAPGNVVRAGGALVSPRLMAAASSLRTFIPGALREDERVAERPDWLDLYR